MKCKALLERLVRFDTLILSIIAMKITKNTMELVVHVCNKEKCF